MAPVDIQLVRAEAKHAGETGRICYEAFRDISEGHGFPPDFPSVAAAQLAHRGIIGQKGVYGVVALRDGRVAGSNFLSMLDPVASVGPITVDPSSQNGGIGRLLMEDVLRHARERGFTQVRLMQDSFNTSSLSLYARLGFDIVEPVVLMSPLQTGRPDLKGIRTLKETDMGQIERLSSAIYRTSRANEVAALRDSHFLPLVIEHGSCITGYLVPGFVGHGVAESEEDALALVQEAAARVGPEPARFFCPLTLTSLYRRFLEAGCKAIKVMNLMAIGPYQRPQGVWMPSIGY
ncbi:MAG: GNAT family N-acetyltransferase [Acidobacteria bacterium]|nr:GNAT family N-acetyltransferase [Acidobacteriota bacterium]